VSVDGNSYFESLWDSMACSVGNVIDAYGWIVPALLLTVLLLGVIVLIGSFFEDFPVELPILEGIGGIFKWARERWGPRGLTLLHLE